MELAAFFGIDPLSFIDLSARTLCIHSWFLTTVITNQRIKYKTYRTVVSTAIFTSSYLASGRFVYCV